MISMLTISFSGCEMKDDIESIKSIKVQMEINKKRIKEGDLKQKQLEQENKKLQNKVNKYENDATSFGTYFLYFTGLFMALSILNLIFKFILRG